MQIKQWLPIQAATITEREKTTRQSAEWQLNILITKAHASHTTSRVAARQTLSQT